MSEKQKPSLKKLFLVLFITAALALAFYRGVLIPTRKTAASARQTLISAKDAYWLIKNQDLLSAGEKLKEVKTSMQVTQVNLNALDWSKKIPFFGNYYQDANHAVSAGIYGIDAGLEAINALEPHVEILGLKGEGSFVSGSADVRIEKAVRAMAVITPEIDQIKEKFYLVKKETDQINPKHYPSVIFGKKIPTQVTLLKNFIDQGFFILNEGLPLVENLPQVLGEPKPKKYFVLFLDNRENKLSDKAAIAYCVFYFNRGRISLDRSNYLYRLNQFEVENLATAKDFKKLSDYLKYKINVDGIVVVSGQTLVRIIDTLAPLNLAGDQLTTKLNPNCNCPQILWELETNPNTRASFGPLMNGIVQEALSSSPRLYWGKLAETIIEEFKQNRLLVYFFDQEIQAGVEALSMSPNAN